MNDLLESTPVERDEEVEVEEPVAYGPSQAADTGGDQFP